MKHSLRGRLWGTMSDLGEKLQGGEGWAVGKGTRMRREARTGLEGVMPQAKEHVFTLWVVENSRRFVFK